jgi:multiple sugar transport system permease protein
VTARGERIRLADRAGYLAGAALLPSAAYLVALVLVPLGLTVASASGGLRAVLREAVVWRSLGHTLALTGAVVVLVVPLGKVLAYVLRARVRGRWAVRVLVLLPWTTPVALSALSWRGLLASLPHGLDRPYPAMATVVAVHVWRLTPLAAVVMAAGLSAVPRDLDDAARLDGAGFWRRTFGVTVPLTLPADVVTAMFVAAATFGDLAVVGVLTGGGPRGATQVLPTLAYARDTRGGATVALFLLPLLLAAVAVVVRAVRREAP